MSIFHRSFLHLPSLSPLLWSRSLARISLLMSLGVLALGQDAQAQHCASEAPLRQFELCASGVSLHRRQFYHCQIVGSTNCYWRDRGCGVHCFRLRQHYRYGF